MATIFLMGLLALGAETTESAREKPDVPTIEKRLTNAALGKTLLTDSDWVELEQQIRKTKREIEDKPESDDRRAALDQIDRLLENLGSIRAKQKSVPPAQPTLVGTNDRPIADNSASTRPPSLEKALPQPASYAHSGGYRVPDELIDSDWLASSPTPPADSPVAEISTADRSDLDRYLSRTLTAPEMTR